VGHKVKVGFAQEFSGVFNNLHFCIQVRENI